MKLSTNLPDISVWKTITIGEHKYASTSEAIDQLKSKDFFVRHTSGCSHFGSRSPLLHRKYDTSDTLIGDYFVRFNHQKEEVKLACIMLKSIMNENEDEISFQEICYRIKAFGLELCPHEVPIALAEVLGNESSGFGTEIVIATDPFPYCDTLLTIGEANSIGRELNYFLYAGGDNFMHDPSHFMVFRISE